MEPPRGFLGSLWSFIRFLPYFTGLLILGTIKGIIFCPLACLIIGIGNSSIVIGLWPLHLIWTYYSILLTKRLGPVLKLVLCIFLPIPLILWPVIGIIGSIIGGALYGFLSPIFATVDSVGEGKTDVLYHSFNDGTWDTITRSCTIVRDFLDVCYHSYFSLTNELKCHVKYYEIRLRYLPGAITACLLGILVDVPVVSLVALYKAPYMLLKGYSRLCHDLIGREGPFLETICVPFAGLAILLWPLAVVGAVLGSIASSIFLGAFAGFIVYQESSFWLGLCYIVASLAIYDEYSNDVLDLPEGSCFPSPRFQRKTEQSKHTSHAASFSRPSSFRDPPARTYSLNNPMVDLKPLELLDSLFKDCQQHGEVFVAEGLISQQDIEDAKSTKGSRVISIGLPAYCILLSLLRSAKANCAGILFSDEMTEISSSNRPRDAFFDWFLNPFLVMQDQIKAANLTDVEEEYLSKLVLLGGDSDRLKSINSGSLPESEIKRAELDALARRLQGITKSISRYPTMRRQFQNLVKKLSEHLAEKNNGGKTPGNASSRPIGRSKSAHALVRMFSSKSFKNKSNHNGSSSDQESQSVAQRNVEIV